MADDTAVNYSIGFLEGWINIAEEKSVNGAEQARTHLKIIEDAYKEYRLNTSLYRRLVQEAKDKLNAVPIL